MSAVIPFPTPGATLVLTASAESQELLCALFAHEIKVTAVTVSLDAPVAAALASAGMRVVMRHNRYEVVK